MRSQKMNYKAQEQNNFITQVWNTGIDCQGQAKKTIVCFVAEVPEAQLKIWLGSCRR